MSKSVKVYPLGTGNIGYFCGGLTIRNHTASMVTKSADLSLCYRHSLSNPLNHLVRSTVILVK